MATVGSNRAARVRGGCLEEHAGCRRLSQYRRSAPPASRQLRQTEAAPGQRRSRSGPPQSGHRASRRDQVKLATWNVNSLKVRLPQLLPWLTAHAPDVVCLQETKTEDANFPVEEIRAAGYQPLFAGQKTYNGVAILSRTPATEVVTRAARLRRRAEARAGGDRRWRARDLRVRAQRREHRVGRSTTTSCAGWTRCMPGSRDELKRYPRLALLGDYNIAPEDRDVHDPRLWEGKVLFSEPEKAAFRRLLGLGSEGQLPLVRAAGEVLHLVGLPDEPVQAQHGAAHRSHPGVRGAGRALRACAIDRDMRAQERPSDHAPVVAEIGG